MKFFSRLILGLVAFGFAHEAFAQGPPIVDPAALTCTGSGGTWQRSHPILGGSGSHLFTMYCHCEGTGRVNALTLDDCPRDGNSYDYCVTVAAPKPWNASRPAPEPQPRPAPPPAEPKPAPPLRRVVRLPVTAPSLPPPSEPTQCANGADDDGDTWMDLRDPDCRNDPTGLSERGDACTDRTCCDGLDNDGDGYFDGNDSDCTFAFSDDEQPPSEPARVITALPPSVPEMPRAPEPAHEATPPPAVPETPPPARDPAANSTPVASPTSCYLAQPPIVNCAACRNVWLYLGLSASGFAGPERNIILGTAVDFGLSIEPTNDFYVLLDGGPLYTGAHRVGAEAGLSFQPFPWRHVGFGFGGRGQWANLGVAHDDDNHLRAEILNLAGTAGLVFRNRYGHRLYLGALIGESVFEKGTPLSKGGYGSLGFVF